MRLDHDMRVEARDRGGGALDLGPAEIGRRMDHLALQVRERHGIVVDHAEGADARRREIEQGWRAEPARADHQHTRALERGLAWPAHLAQHDVAGITFELVGGQHVVLGAITPASERLVEAHIDAGLRPESPVG